MWAMVRLSGDGTKVLSRTYYAYLYEAVQAKMSAIEDARAKGWPRPKIRVLYDFATPPPAEKES